MVSPMNQARSTIHVCLTGNDRSPGTLAEPVRTLGRAQGLARAARKAGRAVQVLLRGGVYELPRTLSFGPQDSGTAHRPTRWSAYPGERVVLSGGRRLDGFTEALVDGKACWALDLPTDWYFHQLWNGDERLPQARLPATGTYQFAGLNGQGDSGFSWGNGPDHAEFKAGDLRDFHNLRDTKIVALQLWFDMHLRPVAVDPQTRIVRFAAKAIGSLLDEKREPARYWIENVREALLPGQWYLDRSESRLYYLPLPGQVRATFAVIAPRLRELVRFKSGVHDVHLERLTLAHNDWEREPHDSGAVQAAYDVPGAVVLDHAERCALYACELAHLGTYAVEIQAPSHGNTIAACAMHDLGGGGVKIGHEELAPHTSAVGQGMRPAARSIATTVADCTIRDGGRRYLSSIGVLVGNSGHNRILRNEISFMRYTGISCGWTWSFTRTRTVGNRIHGNHIHHINHERILSDNGGIYTLGRHPGSTIQGNHLHDIACYGYGGWGIYLDEGSSEFLVEGNLVHRTGGPGFFMHYGRAVSVRHNVLCAADGHMNVGRLEPQRSCTLERNVLLVRSGALQAATACDQGKVLWRDNLIFDPRGEPHFGGQLLRSLQKHGQHLGLVTNDPLFLDPAGGDFRCAAGSPVLALGLTPLDPNQAGPRRHALPAAFSAWRAPAVKELKAVETTLAMVHSLRATATGQEASIAITVENRGSAKITGRLRIVADPAAGVSIASPTMALSLAPGATVSRTVLIHAPADCHTLGIETRPQIAGAVPHRIQFLRRPLVQVPRVRTACSIAEVQRLLPALPGQRLLSPGGLERGELRLGLAGNRLALLATVLDATPRAMPTPWEGSVLEVFAYQNENSPKGQVFLVPEVDGAPARMQHVDKRGLPITEDGELRTRTFPGGWTLAALIPASALHVSDFDTPFLIEVAATGVNAENGLRLRAAWIGAPSPHSSHDGCAEVFQVIIPGLD